MHLALLYKFTSLVVEDMCWHAVQGEFAREKAILEIPNFLRRTSSSLSVLLLVSAHTHVKVFADVKGIVVELARSVATDKQRLLPLGESAKSFCTVRSHSHRALPLRRKTWMQ